VTQHPVPAIAIGVVQHVIVEPVSQGRLRRRGWPDGLSPVVVLGLVIYLLAAVATVANGPIRRALPSGDSAIGVSPVLYPIALVVAVVLTTLLTTAALRAPLLLRVAGLVAPTTLWFSIANYANAPVNPLVPVIALLVLVALVVWRARTPFAWWEFTVVLAVIGATTLWLTWEITIPAVRGGYLDSGLAALVVLFAVGVFAVPVTVSAGAAVSEVAFTTALWLPELLSRHLRPQTVRWCVAALAVVALVVVGWRWAGGVLPLRARTVSLLVALVVLLVSWAVWRALDAWFDRSPAGSPEWGPFVPDTWPEHLLPGFRGTTLAVAVVMSAPFMINIIWSRAEYGLQSSLAVLDIHYVPLSLQDRLGLGWLGTSFTDGLWPALLLCVVLTVINVRQRRRGAAELVAIMGLLALLKALAAAGVWFTAIGMDDFALAGLLVVLAVLLVRVVRSAHGSRSLGAQQWEDLAAALLLAVAVGARDVLADPLSLVFGTIGGGLVFLGLAWTLLTGAEDANGHSRRFPQPARVLAVVAYLSTAAALTAFDSLAVDFQVDLERFALNGAEICGTALVVAGLWSVLLSRRPDAPPLLPVAGR